MNKTHEELAAEILIAGIGSQLLHPAEVSLDVKAESLMRLYGIILAGLRNPPPPRLPKAK